MKMLLGHLKWFASHLDTLAKDSRVNLELYVTRSSEEKADDETRPESMPVTPSSETDLEKAVGNVTAQPLQSSSEESVAEETDSSQTAGPVEVQPHAYQSSIKRGKPDVAVLIQTIIGETPVEQRVLVLGCGPDGLMATVRNTTAACIRSDGPGVELHCEQFGW